MKPEDKVCSRSQAIQLFELGVHQPKHDDDFEHGKLWQPGDIYSVIVHDKEKIYTLGNQEDFPPKMYDPVKLYDCAELGAMLGGYCEAFLTKRGTWKGDNDDKTKEFLTEAQAKADTLIRVLIAYQGDDKLKHCNYVLTTF